MTQDDKALISFSIGPVQDFIAAARTTRDLYHGSRLLGLLAGAAVEVVREKNGTFIFPSIASGPLPKSLPNTFVAEVPEADAQRIVEDCRKAVIDKWRKLSHDVRVEIVKALGPAPGWDVGWQDQIDHFWDIRVLSIPVSAGQDPEVHRLLGNDAGVKDPFSNAMLYLQKLAAAHKQIRHYPPHESDGRGETPIETRPKCSLLGTLAQMGPRQHQNQMAASAKFWDDLRRDRSVGGIRIGRADRLCAVSLIKRFASLDSDSNGDAPLINRFADVDTICASQWLEQTGLTEEAQQPGWSGHWLRWKKQPNEEEAAAREEEAADRDEEPADRDGEAADRDEDPCPQETWVKIKAARKEHKSPPAYFAVLMIDGDNIGSRLAKSPRDAITKISAELNRFAAQIVPSIVTRHHGTLVYAGGDDVLAFLPALQAIPCARAISKDFDGLNMPSGSDSARPTVSAGVAIVHYKENLRLALATARGAEAAAKSAGRNRLALAVQRRSGGRETLALTWDEARTLTEISAHFNTGPNGASDRWAYQFRQLRETLSEAADLGAGMRMELKRLLARSEGTSPEFRKKVMEFWDALHPPSNTAQKPDSVSQGAHNPDLLFIDGILAASFLARVPKE